MYKVTYCMFVLFYGIKTTQQTKTEIIIIIIMMMYVT